MQECCPLNAVLRDFVFPSWLLLIQSVSISDTFHINPQLHLILSEMEEVIVSLNQHSIMEPKVQQKLNTVTCNSKDALALQVLGFCSILAEIPVLVYGVFY
jgi:hypothetical protein